jgi:hypothetical protein
VHDLLYDGSQALVNAGPLTITLAWRYDSFNRYKGGAKTMHDFREYASNSLLLTSYYNYSMMM